MGPNADLLQRHRAFHVVHPFPLLLLRFPHGGKGGGRLQPLLRPFKSDVGWVLYGIIINQFRFSDNLRLRETHLDDKALVSGLVGVHATCHRAQIQVQRDEIELEEETVNCEGQREQNDIVQEGVHRNHRRVEEKQRVALTTNSRSAQMYTVPSDS